MRQDFNPTMVRLKQMGINVENLMLGAFQSHNGSIKTYNIANLCEQIYAFQSHNGSIKTDLLFQIFSESDEISIPQWFD